MRYGKDTIKQANDLIQNMRRYGVKAFDVNMFGLTERNEMQWVVRLAKEYHRIQEHDCNGTKTPRMATRETTIENLIRDIVTKVGLRVHFDGDPRGYCVKLHAPNQDVYNTWGGKESGYGIG